MKKLLIILSLALVGCVESSQELTHEFTGKTVAKIDRSVMSNTVKIVFTDGTYIKFRGEDYLRVTTN